MTTTIPPLLGTIGVTPTFGNSLDSTVARAIQWFTATRDDYSGVPTEWAPAKVNHAVVYVGVQRGYVTPQLVQANPGGASFADWDSYGSNMIWLNEIHQETDKALVGPVLTPTTAQRLQIAAWAANAARVGIGYNYVDFVAIALAQKRFGKLGANWESKGSPWWVDRLSDDNRLICSQLADMAWRNAGLQIFADNRPAGLVSPEDLYLAGINAATA